MAESFKALDPYARRWNAMENEIRDAIAGAGFSEQDLNAIIDLCASVTSTNCWYATFNVAPIVSRLASELRYRMRVENDSSHGGDGRE